MARAANRSVARTRQQNPETSTLLLVGAGLVGAYFLFRGKVAAAAGLPSTQPPVEPPVEPPPVEPPPVEQPPVEPPPVEQPPLTPPPAGQTGPIVTPDGAGAVVGTEQAQVEPTPPATPPTPDAPIVPSVPPPPRPPVIVVQVDHKQMKGAARLRLSSKGASGRLVINGVLTNMPVPSAPVSITYTFGRSRVGASSVFAPLRLAVQYPGGQRSATIVVTPAEKVVKQVIFESKAGSSRPAGTGGYLPVAGSSPIAPTSRTVGGSLAPPSTFRSTTPVGSGALPAVTAFKR